MSETATEHSDLLTALANRLRLVQVDAAQEEPAARQQYLADEIKEALDRVPPHERRPFLERLAEHFPIWEVGEDAVKPEQPEEKDLAGMLQAVAEQGQKLPEAQRAEVLKRLRQAWGVADKDGAAAAGGGQGDAVLAAIASKLGLGPGAPADPGRAADLAGTLVEFVTRLEPLVRSTWRTLNPDAPAASTLQQAMSRYVRGEPNIAMARDLGQLRAYLAAFMDALTKVPRLLYQRHLHPLEPEEVKEVVRSEGFSIKGLDARCWVRYTELAQDLSESRVAEAAQKIAAEVVDGTMELWSKGRP